MTFVMERSLALRGLLAVVLALSFVLVAQPAAEAGTDSAAELDFACRVNAERESRGDKAMRVASDLREVARAHSVRMADENRLYHNPNYSKEVTGWTVVAENVGRGPSVSSLHAAFMDSTGHRRNILDSRFTEVGMGVERRGSTVWITQLFRKPSGGASGSLPRCGDPVVGDWNGDGRVTPGIFRDGRWELANSFSGKTDIVLDYGRRGDVPIVGDWNGNGRTTVGIVRDGTWHLKNGLSGGGSDISFVFGRVSQGDVPIAGNWNGRGGDGIGIIRDGEWHLRNTLSGGAGQISFVYGRITRGDVPLIGDWNGNGHAGIGIVRQGEWHLRNSLSGGNSQKLFVYGRVLKGDVPVIGDWNVSGQDGVGIVRSSQWHLRNSLSGGDAQIQFTY